MKKTALLSLFAASVAILANPVIAGDAAVGKQKATACIACHGSDSYPGIFYTLQLAGRNADKLEIKTLKYKTGKILHPMMNLAVSFFNEQEISDIAAYYESLGKPAFTSPLFNIKTDADEEKAQAAAAAVPYILPAFPAYPVAPK
jgi:cytochrome c553